VASLFVIQGRDQGTRYDLDPRQTAVGVGRDAANTIQLHDTEVSRVHAEFRARGSTYTLNDLGSSNGTFVNGRRVTQCELTSGDQVQIGRTFMLFTGMAEPPDDLDDKIDIVTRQPGSEKSRIVRSISQEEGSEIFKGGADVGQTPWLARARSNLQIMYRTALAVSHTLDIDQLLNRIMQLIFEWVEADRGTVMLLDPESKQLVPKVRHNRRGIRADDKLTISKTILDYVMTNKEGVLTSDAREDQRFDAAASILQMGIREAICVPLQGRYDTVGVIYIDTSTPAHRVVQQGGTSNKFTEEHLKLMVAIAHQAALAVEDTSYYSAMVQSERLAAVGQTIAMLSHHIKNILQGIRGGSYLIELGLTEHDESIVRKGWDIVDKNQNRISTLVMDMLTFSKEREPEMVTADLNQVVSDVVELMKTRADEHHVELVWDPAEAIPQLTFDPEGIHRAVLNVVTNAIDACRESSRYENTAAAEHEGILPPEGAESEKTPSARSSEECETTQPRVTVSTVYTAEPGLAQIVVEDQGCGISADDLSKVFTLFVSRKGSRGTGLGLPVSQKILKEHGGRIFAESTEGKGSRFVLEFPALLPDPVRETGANTTVS
jgi:two-component system NtrC family sensor kinase